MAAANPSSSLPPGHPSEELESIHQWASASRRFTLGAPLLERPTFPGLDVGWANVMMPVYNLALLTSPCTSLDDLSERLDPLLAFAEERAKPWFFTPCDAWLPEDSDALLESKGLTKPMRMMGMVATGITPAEGRPDLDIRRLSGCEGAVLIGQLNCPAYGMPAEWAEETNWESFFGSDVFSYALYENGEPVSTATVFVIDNCLNVVAVATLPGFQRKGYANLVMRHALEQASEATGIHRTVLHATDAGRPVYERMGYRPVVGFSAWTPAHP